MYLLWSYLPSPFLHQLGIYYYPNRWWSLALPAYLVMSVLYIYVALAAYNTGYLTRPLHDIENMVDDAGKIALISRAPPTTSTAAAASSTIVADWKDSIWNQGTDAVMDIPIGAVCEILYGAAAAGGTDDDDETSDDDFVDDDHHEQQEELCQGNGGGRQNHERR